MVFTCLAGFWRSITCSCALGAGVTKTTPQPSGRRRLMRSRSTGISWTDSGFTCSYSYSCGGESNGGGSKGRAVNCKRMERGHAPISRRPQKAGHVALHRLGLADVLGAPVRLCLRPLVERLADTLLIQSEHHLLDRHDALSALFEPDDGDGCIGIGSRGQQGRQKMDTADDPLRPDLHRAPLDRMEAPD